MSSIVKKCVKGCTHAFQDRQYGKGIRVHRVSKKGEERCTVCEPTAWKRRLKGLAAAHTPAFNLAPKSSGPIYGGN